MFSHRSSKQNPVDPSHEGLEEGSFRLPIVSLLISWCHLLPFPSSSLGFYCNPPQPHAPTPFKTIWCHAPPSSWCLTSTHLFYTSWVWQACNTMFRISRCVIAWNRPMDNWTFLETDWCTLSELSVVFSGCCYRLVSRSCLLHSKPNITVIHNPMSHHNKGHRTESYVEGRSNGVFDLVSL